MDLLALKLNTIFKLNLLGLEQKELDRVCDRVMRGNTKSVRKIVRQYIQRNNERRSNNFFDEFTKKKNNRFLKRLSVEQVKEMIALELNRCLRHDYRSNMSNLRFQEIVLNAIDLTSRSPLEEIKNNIPQWIKQQYVDVKVKETKDEVKVISDPEAIFNIKLLKEKQNIAPIVQDVFELIDHLEYINNLRQKIKKRESKATLIPPQGGMIDAFDYAEYLRQAQVTTSQLRDELRAQETRTKKFLAISKVPDEIKKEILNCGFTIKNKHYKMFLLKLRKQFEAFVINEKYGQPSEKVWNQQTLTMMRRAVMCFEYSQENPTIDLNQLLLNSIKCDKKRFNKLMKLMIANKHVKVVKTGQIKDNFYIVYDYLAPRKWFNREKFFKEVEEKLKPQPRLYEGEEVAVRYKFPYYSNWQVQQRFAYNFRIFLNKNGITGMSDRQVDKMNVGINSFQIYYPIPFGYSKKTHIQEEAKIREYKKVYSSFHHKLKYNTKGTLMTGGNIVREISFETGDEDLDFFIADIDARKSLIHRWILGGDPLQRLHVYEAFFAEVKRCYAESHQRERLHSFLDNIEKQHDEFIEVINAKSEEILALEKEADPLHGNSRAKKKLLAKINRLRKKMPSEKTMKSIRDKYKQVQGIRDDLAQGVFNNDLKLMLFERLDSYCEVRHFRKVHLERDVISYALVMINNLNMKGIARTYDSKKSGVFHKYLTEHDDKFVIFKDKPTRLSDLFKCVLRMTVQMRDKEIFDELFDFLFQHELETKEKLLLMEFKGY